MLPVRYAMALVLSLATAVAAAAATVAAAATAAVSTAMAPQVAEILAAPPSDLIVTIYRAPDRDGGSIDLDELGGFALVSETRLVHLPAGSSRVRFEGVADGIEPASAIVTGLPGRVVEKNRDARLLSPSALVAAAVGKTVELERTNRKTGKTESVRGTILSDAGGVVFQSAQGIEALRCSGMPETFGFEPAADLSARPTLSVEVQSSSAVTAQVTLSYLAQGFDWAADYTATVAADGKSLDLGAWVTLANSNGVGFPAAHTQVVAGRVNREDGEVDPIEMGGPILAQCWPRGSTSDVPLSTRERGVPMMMRFAAAAPAAMDQGVQMEVVTAGKAQTVVQEQLGDLKLYRVPERTTLASRQSKQVRLMDRAAVPVTTFYGADLSVEEADQSGPGHRLLRTKNTAANHLGLPLPSGTVAVFGSHEGARLLEHESGVRDTAVNEDVEIDMGSSADVQVSLVREKTHVDSGHAEMLPLVPGVVLRSVKTLDTEHVEISNAKPTDIEFELRLRLPEGGQIIRANRAPGTKNGRPIFRLKVPANQSVTLRYQWQRADTRILRTP
jgi:hypothetical protein